MNNHMNCANDEEYQWSQKLYNRLRYYGWDNFDKVILMSGLSERQAKEIEIYLIAKYNTFEKGMNSHPGGSGFLCGANHFRAEAVNVFNKSTGEITSFTWQGGAAQYLGVTTSCIKKIVSTIKQSEQTYSPIYDAWFQIKKAYDETPFIHNMPTPNQKKSISQSGENNHFFGEKHTIESRQKISVAASQRRVTDKQKQERSDKMKGAGNHRANPICVFGNVFACGKDASDAYRFLYDKHYNFVKDWANQKSCIEVFRIPKDVFELLFI